MAKMKIEEIFRSKNDGGGNHFLIARTEENYYLLIQNIESKKFMTVEFDEDTLITLLDALNKEVDKFL